MAEPVPTLRLGNVTYHFPFAHLIRPHTAQERDDLVVSIRAHKRVLVRVVTYDSQAWGERCVIDGIGRLTIAAELGFDVPVQHRGALGDEDARAECLALNVDRRQLSVEEQRAARGRRIERVLAARDSGRSFREIARAEGVSQTQVVRDVAEAPAGVTGVTPAAPSDTGDKPLKVLEKCVRAIVRPERPGQPAGALTELLRGPHRERLERIAARHGAPLDGDRWPLAELLAAVVADLMAETAAVV